MIAPLGTHTAALPARRTGPSGRLVIVFAARHLRGSGTPGADPGLEDGRLEALAASRKDGRWRGRPEDAAPAIWFYVFIAIIIRPALISLPTGKAVRLSGAGAGIIIGKRSGEDAGGRLAAGCADISGAPGQALTRDD